MQQIDRTLAGGDAKGVVFGGKRPLSMSSAVLSPSFIHVFRCPSAVLSPYFAAFHHRRVLMSGGGGGERNVILLAPPSLLAHVPKTEGGAAD